MTTAYAALDPFAARRYSATTTPKNLVPAVPSAAEWGRAQQRGLGKSAISIRTFERSRTSLDSVGVSVTRDVFTSNKPPISAVEHAVESNTRTWKDVCKVYAAGIGAGVLLFLGFYAADTVDPSTQPPEFMPALSQSVAVR